MRELIITTDRILNLEDYIHLEGYWTRNKIIFIKRKSPCSLKGGQRLSSMITWQKSPSTTYYQDFTRIFTNTYPNGKKLQRYNKLSQDASISTYCDIGGLNVTRYFTYTKNCVQNVTVLQYTSTILHLCYKRKS